MQAEYYQTLAPGGAALDRSAHDPLPERLVRVVRALSVRIRRYHELARQRQALRELSDRQLKDIGISRVDALQEADKPFWRE